MTINYNVTGAERKRLAQALGEILRWEPVYTKAPAFAYVIGNYTIDKNGVIFCPDSATPEDIERIIETLKESGFVPVEATDNVAETSAEMPDAAPEPEDDNDPDHTGAEATEGEISPNTADEPDEADSGSDNARLTVTLPRSVLPDDALGRLKMIVANKEPLFKRALLTDALPIDVSENEVSFPWFTLTGTDGEAAAYTQFVTALCKMAREQTRILDKPYDGDNDRFAMRIFMVRLGMKGREFAPAS